MGNRRKRSQIRNFITREQKSLPERVRQLEVICDALARVVGVKKMTAAIAERIAEDRGQTAEKAPGLVSRALAKLRGESKDAAADMVEAGGEEGEAA